MGIILIIILVLMLIGVLPTWRHSSGWSDDWLANLLLLENYHLGGKENEGISLAVSD